MALDLDALRAFVKVAELGSFTRAAAQLGLSKSRVSMRVQALERELGSQLLQRSTRAVRPTAEGEQLRQRAERLLREADDVGAMFQTPRTLRGRLRVDMPVLLARNHVIPRLPELLALHPQLELHLSTTDRLVDLLREGFDCVLRVGELTDSSLTARRLGAFRMVNVVSPSYVARHGLPRTLEELDDHLLVNWSNQLEGDPPTFEWFDGTAWRERPMRSSITVNSTDGYHAACLAGLGVIQAPALSMSPLVARGELVELLPDHPGKPLQVHLLHGFGRSAPRRVRVFMDWLAEVLTPHLA